jgi:hypothetical protein
MSSPQRRLLAMCCSTLLLASSFGQTPLGTAFTYQGQLKVGGGSADGSYDLRFTLYDAASLGNVVAGPICSDNVSVSDGLFTATLDFGSAAFDGHALWLEVGVRADADAGNCGAGAYNTLSPRQALSATPYALGLRLPFDGSASLSNGPAMRVTNTADSPVFVSYGIWGQSEARFGRGIYGRASHATSGIGVFGQADGQFGYAGYFVGPQNFFDGSVGIGTNSFDLAKLAVQGDSAVPYAIVATGSETGLLAEGLTGIVGQATTPSGFGGVFKGSDPSGNGSGQALRVYGSAQFDETVNIGGNSSASIAKRLQVENGTDVQLGGGGYVVVGDTQGANIAIDNNEIVARNHGATSTLFLNNDGGNVSLISNGIGNVGIGTSSPAQKLHVNGSIQASCGVLSCSDERFKTHIEPLSGALTTVQKLRPVSFDWRVADFPERNFRAGRDSGFIAQEVESAAPELVQKGADGFYSLEYSKLTPLLTAAIQELQATVNRQRTQVEALQSELATLRARFDAMEARQ